MSAAQSKTWVTNQLNEGFILADCSLEAAKQTANMSQSRKALHVTDYEVHALQVDVRDEKGVQQMVDETESVFGRIDYFVNTAGVSPNTAWIVGLEMSQLLVENVVPI